ncbi:MAG TPA: serine hydrolase [Anaeromyxobacteraceae bacterium]|nr:serine hydrolase [Anaeromyxobacteraceae bacterium]
MQRDGVRAARLGRRGHGIHPDLERHARARPPPARRRFYAGTRGGYEAFQPFLVDGAPYGGLVGTAPDLARFLGAHLGGGSFEGKRILSEASAAAMREPQRDLRGRALPVGLGWHLGALDGEPFAYHLGGGAGFRSELRIYPRLDCGAAVVANETSFDTGQVTRLVVGR